MDKILERSNGSAIIELENNNIKKLFQSGCSKVLNPNNYNSINELVLINTAGGITCNDIRRRNSRSRRRGSGGRIVAERRRRSGGSDGVERPVSTRVSRGVHRWRLRGVRARADSHVLCCARGGGPHQHHQQRRRRGRCGREGSRSADLGADGGGGVGPHRSGEERRRGGGHGLLWSDGFLRGAGGQASGSYGHRHGGQRGQGSGREGRPGRRPRGELPHGIS